MSEDIQENEKLFNLSGVIKRVLYQDTETKYVIAVLENNQKFVEHILILI